MSRRSMGLVYGNKSMLLRSLAVLLVAVIGLSAATDRYVQQGAVGAFPCAQADPCGDFATVFGGAIADGDKIIIQGPSYLPATGNEGFTVTASITIWANITDGPVRIDLASSQFADIQGVVVIEGIHFNCTGSTGSAGGALSVSTAAGALTLTDVNFDKCTSTANGGAIAVHDGRLTVNGGSFVSCAAKNGGAIHVDVNAASVFVSGHTVFESNSATMDGGAVYAVSAEVNPLGDIFFQDAIFRSNAAPMGSGGAVFAHTTARTKFFGCKFESNSALSGGALNLPLSSNFENCFIQDCTFESNVASGTSISLKSGGAIFHTNPIDIRNTQFMMNNASRDGGAIFSQADITVADSTLERNAAQGTSSGGALFLDYASVPQLNRNSFVGNKAGGHGAAVYAESLTLAAVANEFTSNVAGAQGGAIFNKVGVLAVTGGSMSHNWAGSMGGAVFTAGLTTVSGATFTNNNASTGGAIYCSSIAQGASALALTVVNTMFSMNQANSADGGAIFGGACSLSVSGSKFSTNSAAAQGGAISSASATVAVSNSDFSMNNAEDGGGIHATSSLSFELTGITGTSNVVSNLGGFVFGSGVSGPVIRSSSLAGSVPQDYHFVQGDSDTVQFIDSAVLGSVGITNGTLKIDSAQPVTLAGFTLLGQSSLSINSNITVTGTMVWEDGTISTQSTEMIVLSLAEGAVANLVRNEANVTSIRRLDRVHLFSAGRLNIGVITELGTNETLTPGNLTREGVNCLTLASNASIILQDVASAKARIGYNCIIAVEPNTSYSVFNVSSHLDIDGTVTMFPAFTSFNNTAANLVFHVRMMDANVLEFQDVDHLVLTNSRNDTRVGGNITVIPSDFITAVAGTLRDTDKEKALTARLISGAWVVGNFSNHNLEYTLYNVPNSYVYNSTIYGTLKTTVAGTNITIREADRPDPKSGQTVVIIVSVILALIGGGVLAFYIYTVVKCFKKSGDDDESDDSDDEEAGEKKSLTKASEEAEKREKEAMAKVDAEQKAAAKASGEIKEVDDEKPTKKGKGKGKGKEKETAPEPAAEPAAAPAEEKPKKKSSKVEDKPAPVAEEKPASKKKKVESSEEPSEESEVSSSSDTSESSEAAKKPLKSSGKKGTAPAKKSSKSKPVESSSTESDS